MNREQALHYTSYILDDSGNISYDLTKITEKSVFVGWQCGFEPFFVVVQSYLDVQLDEEEAVEIAVDYLTEKKWFYSGDTDPDYIL